MSLSGIGNGGRAGDGVGWELTHLHIFFFFLATLHSMQNFPNGELVGIELVPSAAEAQS